MVNIPGIVVSLSSFLIFKNWTGYTKPNDFYYKDMANHNLNPNAYNFKMNDYSFIAIKTSDHFYKTHGACDVLIGTIQKSKKFVHFSETYESRLENFEKTWRQYDDWFMVFKDVQIQSIHVENILRIPSGKYKLVIVNKNMIEQTLVFGEKNKSGYLVWDMFTIQ